mmetsp:Transcript_12579/g.36744  ORF Transcript_12579/g.36744 Transcript_12579/m.36744 type:complete len:445 (+) Transcript_12579:430-1764(+)
MSSPQRTRLGTSGRTRPPRLLGRAVSRGCCHLCDSRRPLFISTRLVLRRSSKHLLGTCSLLFGRHRIACGSFLCREGVLIRPSLQRRLGAGSLFSSRDLGSMRRLLPLRRRLLISHSRIAGVVGRAAPKQVCVVSRVRALAAAAAAAALAHRREHLQDVCVRRLVRLDLSQLAGPENALVRHVDRLLLYIVHKRRRGALHEAACTAGGACARPVRWLDFGGCQEAGAVLAAELVPAAAAVWAQVTTLQQRRVVQWRLDRDLASDDLLRPHVPHRRNLLIVQALALGNLSRACRLILLLQPLVQRHAAAHLLELVHLGARTLLCLGALSRQLRRQLVLALDLLAHGRAARLQAGCLLFALCLQLLLGLFRRGARALDLSRPLLLGPRTALLPLSVRRPAYHRLCARADRAAVVQVPALGGARAEAARLAVAAGNARAVAVARVRR